MYEANAINKISVKSTLSVNNMTMIPFLYVDEVSQTKAVYSIVNNVLNLVNQAEKNITLYIDASSNAEYYEYRLPLKTDGIRIYGQDVYGNELQNLLKNHVEQP